ncbi:iron-containing alcohol dehydrogenase [Blastopirellula sp. JC732]|uniref:Iron-containing alcohol dehydrogenase n=1 Tax=Blastopirellula sediminis TaxID=2894196 RepID=A0A9X1MR12_9BACT|nr:iron-containing alcohol dehydrogenase [Blastopirellula sediminis]MCC9605916.1 iron-containing alcohol dehydrogenase [Blastopirellula sediminis]MCC9630785.1 iron-containing alcohol dehydrogenase [Blastopirellula sediminis]
MIPFDFQPRTRIVFGPGVVSRLGELAVELGAKRVLVVSDSGVIKAGHSQKGIDSLTASGVESILFDGVQENPTTANVDAGVAVAKANDIQLIVGLGGGSAMDCAKGINFLVSNGGRMQDYWGVGKAHSEMLPMIAVPTTAGTGSETQSFALISDAETHVKMACGDPKASCKVALLDPELTVTQPQRVTALTGIDAIAHALETYVTRKRNSCSLAFSRGAWRMLASNFATVLKDPTNLEARGGMQLGACFAGLAIENSMLGAAHALANPLTSTYGIVHGQAVAVMLPHVIRYNAELVGDWYRELLQVDVPIEGFPSGDHPEALADFVKQLVAEADLATDLKTLGVDPVSTTQLGVDAAKQWTGAFNPREVDSASLKALYDAAL